MATHGDAADSERYDGQFYRESKSRRINLVGAHMNWPENRIPAFPDANEYIDSVIECQVSAAPRSRVRARSYISTSFV